MKFFGDGFVNLLVRAGGAVVLTAAAFLLWAQIRPHAQPVMQSMLDSLGPLTYMTYASLALLAAITSEIALQHVHSRRRLAACIAWLCFCSGHCAWVLTFWMLMDVSAGFVREHPVATLLALASVLAALPMAKAVMDLAGPPADEDVVLIDVTKYER